MDPLALSPLVALARVGCAGCIKNAVKVLASQAFEELDSTQPGEGGSEERASGVQWGSGPAPSGSGEALKSSFNEEPTSASSSPLSGLQCTLLAVLVLLNSAMCIITALLMAVHFWRRFSSMCWKPIAPAEQAGHVADPMFRLWSRFRTGMARLFHTPPHQPSAEEVSTAFSKFDRSGNGKMDAEEVLHALVELGVLPLEIGIEASTAPLSSGSTPITPISSEMAISEASTALVAEPSQWKRLRTSMDGATASARTSTPPMGRSLSLPPPPPPPSLPPPPAAALTASPAAAHVVLTRATTSMRPTITRATTLTHLRIDRRKTISDLLALRAARFIIMRFDTNGDKQIDEAEFAQILKRVQSKLTLLPPQERVAGKWAKPPGDLIEPARTERILAAPFSLLRTHAADCQDAMSMTLLTKTNGSRAVVHPIRGLLDPFESLPPGRCAPVWGGRPSRLHVHLCMHLKTHTSLW